MSTTSSTICAIATAPGTGGIAVLRLSGPQAIEIVSRNYKPARTSVDFLQQEAYTISYGNIYSNANETIDDVLISIFRAPHS